MGFRGEQAIPTDSRKHSLVNVIDNKKLMEHRNAINGTTHYFDWAMASIAILTCLKGYSNIVFIRMMNRLGTKRHDLAVESLELLEFGGKDGRSSG